jgi:hypothetical protein
MTSRYGDVGRTAVLPTTPKQLEASNSTCITTYQSAHTALKVAPEDGPVRSETL